MYTYSFQNSLKEPPVLKTKERVLANIFILLLPFLVILCYVLFFGAVEKLSLFPYIIIFSLFGLIYSNLNLLYVNKPNKKEKITIAAKKPYPFQALFEFVNKKLNKNYSFPLLFEIKSRGFFKKTFTVDRTIYHAVDKGDEVEIEYLPYRKHVLSVKVFKKNEISAKDEKEMKKIEIIDEIKFWARVFVGILLLWVVIYTLLVMIFSLYELSI